MAATRSRTVGMIVPELGNPFFTDVAEGADNLADRCEMTLILSGSGNSLDRQTRHLERMQELRVQGVMITPIDSTDHHLVAVSDAGTPVVILSRHSLNSQLCSVFTDDVHGGYLACEHLLAVGHRRLAYVGGDCFPERMDGARAAMLEAGLPPDLLELDTGGKRMQEGRLAGGSIVDLAASERPTAVMCGNDLLALGVLEAMTTRGLRVPTDVAIVGYDDIGFAASASVPMTSIRQPRTELGSSAARLLFDEINDPDRHRHRRVVFEPELVVRASSGGASGRLPGPRAPAARSRL